MMRTGRIPKRRAVEGAVLVMAMSMMTARVRRACRAVRKEQGKGKGTKDGKGKGKGKATEEGKGKATEEGKGKGNGKWKGIVKQTPGGDDISPAVALQLQKEMYEADSDMEG